MNIVDKLAEKYILEAQQQGVFDDLPGAGKPLVLDDDSMVPKQFRAAYRLMKNAGYLPPELVAQQELRQLEQLIAAAVTVEQRDKLTRRQQLLRVKLELFSQTHMDYFNR